MLTDPYPPETFSYDALGNRMGSNRVATQGPVNFTRRDNGLNQYLAWTPSAIYHDDNFGSPYVFPGNGVTMADGNITASFNALNQPMAMWCQVYPAGPSAQFMWFGYDPLGRCVKRWMGNGAGVPVGSNPTTYYYYDGWDLAQEGPNATTVDRSYVHGGRVDEIVASQVNGLWYNHHYDGQGNCIMLTAGAPPGGLQEQYDYDAFGFPYFYTASGGKLLSPPRTRFLFTGREWMSDLRIYDYRARQYQPELGRFLQPDPKEFEAGDYNLYRYCHNDPVNKSDPFGLVSPGDGLIDLPKDVLEKMYKDNRQNNTDSATKLDYQSGKPIKQEYRRDQYRTKDGLKSNSRMGYRDNTQPKNAPPKNIFGKEAPRTSITHSHITGSFHHLPHDRDVADDAHVPSGVGYTGDNGAHMEIYVPRADGQGRGGTFYTDDGVHVYDKDGSPAPH